MLSPLDKNLNISIAEIEDITALCDLLESLFTLEAEFSPDREKQQHGLLKIIQTPQTGLIIIAKLNDVAIGMVNILFTVSTALGERVALLEDMVIASTYQGKGFGSLLMEHAISEARNQQCKRITLLTDKTNLAAQHFYKQHGFIQSEMLPFRLKLE